MTTPHPFAVLEFPRKSLLLAAACIALTCTMAIAQAGPVSGATPAPTASAAPAFDVATIKPHAGRMTMMGLRYQPDGFAGTVTLPMLVQYAYGLQTEDQVSAAPDWAKNEWFEIQAKISAADIAELQKLSPTESNARRVLMMRALLTERFKLNAHSGTKQVPVYELVVARGGSKLKDAATDTNDSLEKGKDGKPLTGYIHFLKDTSVAQGYSMTSLASLLSQPVAGVGRPVLDKTGLTSTYDFTINWSVYSAGAGRGLGSTEDDTASIFGALQELGLKLQPSTGTIDTIIIEHVDHPTAD
jgi:uncharacterized protein (TIGR03435 family)